MNGTYQLLVVKPGIFTLNCKRSDKVSLSLCTGFVLVYSWFTHKFTSSRLVLV